MPSDHIRVWEQTFELDNFTDAEIASALTSIANDGVQFLPVEVGAVRSRWPAGRLSKLFRDRTGLDLSKPMLAERLAEIAISSETRATRPRRPVVDFLRRVDRDAATNPLPITKATWD